MSKRAYETFNTDNEPSTEIKLLSKRTCLEQPQPFLNVPHDVLLMVLCHCTNLYHLKNQVTAHRSLYQTYTTRKYVVLKAVIANAMSEQESSLTGDGESKRKLRDCLMWRDMWAPVLAKMVTDGSFSAEQAMASLDAEHLSLPTIDIILTWKEKNTDNRDKCSLVDAWAVTIMHRLKSL